MRKYILGFIIFAFVFSFFDIHTTFAQRSRIPTLFPVTVKSVTGKDYVTTPFPQPTSATLTPCQPLKENYTYYEALTVCRDSAGLYTETALPIFPFSASIARFVGRYLDGGGPLTNKVEWYGLTGGNPIKVVSEKNRIYIREESTIAAYNLDTFFTKISTEPLKFFYRKMVSGSPNYIEAMIPWQDYFYIGNKSESGWELYHGDTGQILFDFDADDRGYLYLATISGWGIIRDDGTNLRPVSEMLGCCNTAATHSQSSSRGSNKIFPPVEGMPGSYSQVFSFKAGSKYYAALSSNQEIYIYDVTDANNPKFERAESIHGGNPMTMAKTKSGTNDIVAILDNGGQSYNAGTAVSIYDAEDLVGAGSPKKFEARDGAEGYRGLAGDPISGKIFSIGYGLEESKGDKHMYLSVFTPTSKGLASTYKETKYDLGRESSEFTAVKLSYDGGNLVAWGTGSKGRDVKIWTIGTGAPKELDVKDYFSKHYSKPPEGYVIAGSYNNITNAQPYVHQGKSYLFVSTTGQGEVYELNVTGSTSNPINPTNPINPGGNGCAGGNAYSTTTGQPCACVLGQQFKIGDQSEEVKVFQRTLKTAGFYKGKIDGIYGPATSAAAIAQCKSKLNPVRVTPTAQVAPVIGAIADKTIGVNTLEQWTVTATDANKDDLSWSVDWGYGRSPQTCPTRPGAGNSQNWSYTFSNSWVASGKYEVTVYASDCKGHTAQKSFNVTVTGGGGGGSREGEDAQNRE